MGCVCVSNKMQTTSSFNQINMACLWGKVGSAFYKIINVNENDDYYYYCTWGDIARSWSDNFEGGGRRAKGSNINIEWENIQQRLKWQEYGWEKEISHQNICYAVGEYSEMVWRYETHELWCDNDDNDENVWVVATAAKRWWWLSSSLIIPYIHMNANIICNVYEQRSETKANRNHSLFYGAASVVVCCVSYFILSSAAYISMLQF